MGGAWRLPFLQLGLAGDGAADVLEELEVEEAFDVVVGGVGAFGVGTVLGDAKAEIVGHADV